MTETREGQGEDELARLRDGLAELARDIARELLKPKPDAIVIEALDTRATELRGAIRERSPLIVIDVDGWSRWG